MKRSSATRDESSQELQESSSVVFGSRAHLEEKALATVLFVYKRYPTNLFKFLHVCCKNQGTNLHELLCFSEEMVSKFSHEGVSFLCAFGCGNWSQGHTGFCLFLFSSSLKVFC